MINFFLKIKNWQLFLLIFMIPFALQLLIFADNLRLPIPFITNADFNQTNIESGFLDELLIVCLIYVSSWLSWIGCITLGMNNILSFEYRKRTFAFKFSLFFPICYLVFLLVMINTSIFPDLLDNYLNKIIIPLHIFALVCELYCIYYASRTIKTALKKNEIPLGKNFNMFLLFLLYPIGIFFIQPKINMFHTTYFNKKVSGHQMN